MANVIDISIANDIFLELRQRPLSKWQSKICRLGQSYVNYNLTLLITEFWTTAAISIFRFEDLEPSFVKSMDDIAYIIVTNPRLLLISGTRML